MEGDDEYPIGFRFQPKEEELVEYYLVPRLMRQPILPNDCITKCDVYEYHPETLAQAHKSVDEVEWYFLSPRFRMYPNGARPKRKTRDGRGRWKASTASTEAEEVLCNGITFCRSVLNYFEGVPKKEVRTKWIMLELRVPCFELKPDKAGPENKLDELVVCKIYLSPQQKKKDEDEEGTSSACEGDDVGEEACSPTQHGQGTAGSMLFSEKQAGKRPMLEKVRPWSLGTASTQASSSTSNAPWTEAGSGAPGQPTGAHSSQAPQMQRQAGGAFNGQRLVRQPTQQTPALYHQSSSDARARPFGQTTTTTRPPALENLGAPGNPPRRHPGWAWPKDQAWPPVSLQCYYDQNYRGVKPPPASSASSPQPQTMLASSFLPPQQPFFNSDANRRGEAAVPGGSTPCGSYPYQSQSRPLNVNDEQYFVDLATATSNPLSLVGAPTQTAPAPARLVESQAPAAAGAVKYESETGEASGLNKNDVV